MLRAGQKVTKLGRCRVSVAMRAREKEKGLAVCREVRAGDWQLTDPRTSRDFAPWQVTRDTAGRAATSQKSTAKTSNTQQSRSKWRNEGRRACEETDRLGWKWDWRAHFLTSIFLSTRLSVEPSLDGCSRRSKASSVFLRGVTVNSDACWLETCHDPSGLHSRPPQASTAHKMTRVKRASRTYAGTRPIDRSCTSSHSSLIPPSLASSALLLLLS